VWESNLKVQNGGNAATKFNVLPSETIDKVVYRFVRLIRNCPSHQKIEFSMKNNRIIDRQVIEMLLHYAQERVVSINFVHCIFTMDDVIDLLF
jgi:urate oxidase